MPRRPVDALEELEWIFEMMVKLERWGKRLLVAGPKVVRDSLSDISIGFK